MKNKIISITMLLMLISTINAFGISSPYWEDHPLIMERGETKTVQLNIQNMADREDVTLKAEIIEGSDIIFLKQDTFLIKGRTSDTIIPLEITIPKNIQEENTTIRIEFKKIVDQGEGIHLGTGMAISFDVITTNNDVESFNKKWIVVIGTIAFIIILLTILGKRKK